MKILSVLLPLCLDVSVSPSIFLLSLLFPCSAFTLPSLRSSLFFSHPFASLFLLCLPLSCIRAAVIANPLQYLFRMNLTFVINFGSHVEVVFGHFWDHFWSLLGPLWTPLDIHGPSVLHVCSHVYTCSTNGSFLGPLLGPLWRPTATPSGQEEDQSRSQDGSREGSQKELQKAWILEPLEHAILNDSTTV